MSPRPRRPGSQACRARCKRVRARRETIWPDEAAPRGRARGRNLPRSRAGARCARVPAGCRRGGRSTARSAVRGIRSRTARERPDTSWRAAPHRALCVRSAARTNGPKSRPPPAARAGRGRRCGGSAGRRRPRRRSRATVAHARREGSPGACDHRSRQADASFSRNAVTVVRDPVPIAIEEATVKLSYLWRGLPGHPIHPPLTDATIGIYTFATIAAFIDVVGITSAAGAYGWWIALVVGLITTVFTALTGFADWLTLTWGSPIWKTATTHMLAMVSATVFFGLAAIFGHASYTHGDVSAGAFVLTLIGFGLLTLGGWLGGAIVYVHGMRVLSLLEEPASRAAAPIPHPEKEMAEGG
ncbi:MAG: DUF2231 domain-containing protein [Actinobacteria bacterium]|nr:MAG: DUF2231 domain-containing protein [Actinomycetota bacterium]